jgi:hypothetical protein
MRRIQVVQRGRAATKQVFALPTTNLCELYEIFSLVVPESGVKKSILAQVRA